MMRITFRKQAVLGAAAFIVALIPLAAWAQQSTLTSSHIEKIRQNCVSAQVTLQRVQYSDVAIRINRGQSYDGVLSKLMAPFNSRVALNRLDQAPQLTDKTNTIEAAVADFKRHYVEYEDTLSATLAIKCQDRPVAFYDSLNHTRELREMLANDTKRIQVAVNEYMSIVDGIEKSLAGEAE
jgi:hypothetical protein